MRKLIAIALISMTGCANTSPYAEIGCGYHVSSYNVDGRVPCFVEVGLQNDNGAAIGLRHDSHADAGQFGYKDGPDSSSESIVGKWRFE